jgi:hypothetical protein
VKTNKNPDADRVLLQIVPDQLQIITDQANDAVSTSTNVADAASGAGIERDTTAAGAALGAARDPEEGDEMINEVEKEGEWELEVQVVVDGFSPDDAEVMHSMTGPIPVDSDIYNDYATIYGAFPIAHHCSFLCDTPS